jgi:hypothetical protein
VILSKVLHQNAKYSPEKERDLWRENNRPPKNNLMEYTQGGVENIKCDAAVASMVEQQSVHMFAECPFLIPPKMVESPSCAQCEVTSGVPLDSRKNVRDRFDVEIIESRRRPGRAPITGVAPFDIFSE